MSALLHMENVSCSPKMRPDLNEFSLAVRPGTVLALTGSNGSGLSTVCSVLAGDIGRYTGQVMVHDQAVSLRDQNASREAKIGVVRQSLTLIPNFSVLENLLMGKGIVKGLSAGKRAEAEIGATLLLERYQIPISLNALVQELSAAEQGWADVARVLFAAPSIVVFDQTEVRLGPWNRRAFVFLIEQLKSEGRGVIVASHDDDFICEVADEVIRVEDGRVAFARPAGDSLGDSLVENNGHEVFSDDVLSVSQVDGEGARCQFQLSGGQIVGLVGVKLNERQRFIDALGGGAKCGLAASWNGVPLDFRSEIAARQSGIQLVQVDKRRIEGIQRKRLSDLVTGGSSSWFGRIMGRKDRHLSVIEQVELIEDMISAEGGLNVRILLIDRPLIGLDLEHRATIVAALRRLANAGVLVFFATDNAKELQRICDCAVVIEDGGKARKVSLNEAASYTLL